MKNLVEFAQEIKKDWDGQYTAKVNAGRLQVKLNGKLVAEMDERFQVTGDDEDVVEQLEYMAAR